MRELFWQRYSLGELNRKEWEALCDGCGQCCLIREVDDNEVTVYSLACKLLDIEKSRCKDYQNRLHKVADCHKLTAENVAQYHWLPDTCSYRRVYQGKGLPSWHPLLTGSEKRMRKKGMTISDYAIPAEQVPKRKMRQHIIASWRC
ncbi:YcgN family cysteine cluster protein [Parahaliea sp. F7430]|uniref:YcgN family cysteine cluster protein n=1 Tax=Sediminihaliea albiluteola TaxID=2758564 RepID=A0A7W2TWF5_9GAMM|nr:YcgN family cysteine cluster protein [Sediminihaliea albiluteola]